MYIQITTKCNMACRHCCFSCEPGKGEDMPFEIFERALQWDNEFVTLGGGEPTVHPEFWKIFAYTLSTGCQILVITNGKLAHDAMALARMAKHGVIAASLSQTKYHEPVHPAVVEAFDKRKKNCNQLQFYTGEQQDKDYRAFHQVSQVAKSGKCTWGRKDLCCCPDKFVLVDGSIKFCGCEESPIVGHVRGEPWESIDLKYMDIWGEYSCWREWKK